MNQIFSYLQMIPKSVDVFNSSIQLWSYYNSIYFRTFHYALGKRSETEGDYDMRKLCDIEAFYHLWLKIMDKEFDKELKSMPFTSLLSKYVNSIIDLHSLYRRTGLPVEYLDWMFLSYVHSMMSTLTSSASKESNLTSHDTIYLKGRARLLHYHSIKDKDSEKRNSSPLLIVYAPINRFHIMDLNPKRSVVRNLLSNGLDVYLLDLGYPTSNEDNKLSLSDYVDYIRNAIQCIAQKENEKLEIRTDQNKKIAILGYCWGGILALIYTALEASNTSPNNIDCPNVKSLALMATPVDFAKDNTILANWSRSIDIDKMIDEFGNMNGQILDLAFVMRNPPRYTFDKYLKLLKKLSDKEFVDNFIDVERWLYDTPPIPGNLHRQIINNCYRDNLLVKNKMKLNDKYIDLRNVKVPFLIIDAEKDDLVSTESAIAVSDYVSSKEKDFIKTPGGHVALCIGDSAHDKLWPEVAKWIQSKSR
jgi:polyhydroxyalkanoate synthase subunit PhaC